MTRKYCKYILPMLLGVTVFTFCKKKETTTITENTFYEEEISEPQVNPYDLVNDTVVLVDPNVYPPNSLVYLHTKIFETRCAQPGCHDGHFEPDFRTPQSTYNTTVYHNIIKNNAEEEFKYRVVPYDTGQSVLHERITNCCFANINDQMPQDNIGEPLPDEDIQNIENWILSGAPDMFGNIAQFPNKNPEISVFYLATDPSYSINYGEESNRVDNIIYNPFFAPSNAEMNVLFWVSDDSTSTSNLLVNQLKISTNMDDFSSAEVYNATYFSFGGDEFFIVPINTSNFPSNTTLYMRYYVNDGSHPDNTNFPTDEAYDAYKTFWSFIIQ